MKDDDLLVKNLKDPKTREVAFRSMVTLYQRPLYNHLRSLLLDHQDTDDVLQNTLIKVFQNIDQFKGRSKLFSWIYRIATNEALSFLKAKAAKEQKTASDLYEQLAGHLQEDQLYDGDQIDLLLQQAVATLPEKQQIVFKMRYYQDLDYQSISEILQTSVGALKASYHHAVKKIELFLKEH